MFTTKIIAKIPVGYTINWATNQYGNTSPSASKLWLTSQAGTGDWQEYVFRVTSGATGIFATTNFFYLTGGTTPTVSSPLEWYVAYAGVYASPNAEDQLYTDPTFVSGLNSTVIYNNTGNSNVKNERVTYTTPVGAYALKVQSTGAADPGWGGFTFSTQTVANKVFKTRILAKIPVGYQINWGSNAIGTGGAAYWLTSQAGTGDWAEYIVLVNCGSSGTFGTTNFFYLTGGTTPTASSPLTWYVAYANVYEVSQVYVNTHSGISFKATDSGADIIAYGIKQSSTTEPTWVSISPTGNFGTVLNNITSNGTYYIWIKDSTNNKVNTSVNINNIDKIAPSVPTSVLRQSSASGAVLDGSQDVWRNYNLWWGELSATDSGSGVARYEWSYCNGVSQGVLGIGWSSTYGDGSNYSFCIRAIDRVGNTSAWSSPTYVRVSTAPPTCTVTTTSGYDASKVLTINPSKSGVTYSWDGSNYSTSNTTTIASAGTFTAYVKDANGKTGSCSISIASRTEYQHQACSACKSCNYCPSGGVMLSGSYCYKNPFSSASEHDCVDDGGNWVNNKCYSTMYQSTYGTTCGYCGCNTWNTGDNAWYTDSCGGSNYAYCKDKASRTAFGPA